MNVQFCTLATLYQLHCTDMTLYLYDRNRRVHCQNNASKRVRNVRKFLCVKCSTLHIHTYRAMMDSTLHQALDEHFISTLQQIPF